MVLLLGARHPVTILFNYEDFFFFFSVLPEVTYEILAFELFYGFVERGLYKE